MKKILHPTGVSALADGVASTENDGIQRDGRRDSDADSGMTA